MLRLITRYTYPTILELDFIFQQPCQTARRQLLVPVFASSVSIHDQIQSSTESFRRAFHLPEKLCHKHFLLIPRFIGLLLVVLDFSLCGSLRYNSADAVAACICLNVADSVCFTHEPIKNATFTSKTQTRTAPLLISMYFGATFKGSISVGSPWQYHYQSIPRARPRIRLLLAICAHL